MGRGIEAELSLSLSLQSSAIEQVLDILMDILSWEIAEVDSPLLSLPFPQFDAEPG